MGLLSLGIPEVVISPKLGATILWFSMLLAVAGLLAVVMHRFIMQRRAVGTGETSMTRPVLAVLLVGAVVVLAAASLSIEDAQARSLLVGGIVSLSSAAAAFYFASANATEARRDLLKATTEFLTVPDLTGRTTEQARVMATAMGLKLVLPTPTPDPAATIASQTPDPNTRIRSGESIAVSIKS